MQKKITFAIKRLSISTLKRSNRGWLASRLETCRHFIYLCSLARALLERHLSATRKIPSDLLAGSVSRWHLKDASPLWRHLLRAWDALRGSMHPTIRPPLGVAMTISASMVFCRSEDDRPCLATQTWWRARIRYAHDLVQWHEHRS
jgi:hypothetical protein